MAAAQHQSIHRVSARRRSALRIEPVAPGEQPSERVDEDAHLCRLMPTVRVDRRDRELRGWVVPAGVTGSGWVSRYEGEQHTRWRQLASRRTMRLESGAQRGGSPDRTLPPSCGGAEDARIHQGSRPIHNGFKRQPTRYELRALHQQDVTRGQAQETDQLFDRLMSNQILGQRPARAP